MKIYFRPDHIELLLYLHEKIKGTGPLYDWPSEKTVADLNWTHERYVEAESFLTEMGLLGKGSGYFQGHPHACFTGTGRNFMYAFEDEAKETGLIEKMKSFTWTGYTAVKADARTALVTAGIAAALKYFGIG